MRSDSQGLESIGKIRPKQHTVYESNTKSADLDIIFSALSDNEKLPYGMLSELQERTGIPHGTLRHWREHLLILMGRSDTGGNTYSRTERGGPDMEGRGRRYLSFIHERFENGCLLLWDVHASHRHESVKQAAQEHGICLSFIPAGQTAIWQPLDRRIFGIVKQKAKLRFQEVIIRKGLENVDMIDAIVVLIEVWRSLSEQTIRKAWSHLQ